MQTTNVILVDAPHRHDLMSNSCVSVEVEKFNRKLRKNLERFRKVEMVEVVSERNWYTKHEQHLNSEGKESMAKKIASTVECWFNKKVEPIRGKQYTEEETGVLDHQPVQGKIDINPEEGNKEYSSTSGVVDTLKAQVPEQMCDSENILVIADKKSERPRRQPVTRNKDFLWTDIS